VSGRAVGGGGDTAACRIAGDATSGSSARAATHQAVDAPLPRTQPALALSQHRERPCHTLMVAADDLREPKTIPVKLDVGCLDPPPGGPVELRRARSDPESPAQVRRADHDPRISPVREVLVVPGAPARRAGREAAGRGCPRLIQLGRIDLVGCPRHRTRSGRAPPGRASSGTGSRPCGAGRPRGVDPVPTPVGAQDGVMDDLLGHCPLPGHQVRNPPQPVPLAASPPVRTFHVSSRWPTRGTTQSRTGVPDGAVMVATRKRVLTFHSRM
jgi:hypothetical protein